MNICHDPLREAFLRGVRAGLKAAEGKCRDYFSQMTNEGDLDRGSCAIYLSHEVSAIKPEEVPDAPL